jgi:hypothetical protein
MMILCHTSVRRTTRRWQKYEVAIHSGTDCKLYDPVREGELLARRGRRLRG